MLPLQGICSFRRPKRAKWPRAQVAFFSQAEKNQKAKRHGEKLYGEDGRAAAGAAELAALRHCRSETPQLCSRLAGFSQGACHPDGNSEMKLAHKTSLGPLSGSHRAMKHR